jgi:hypothetical protein
MRTSSTTTRSSRSRARRWSGVTQIYAHRGLIQSTIVEKLMGKADDVPGARVLIEAQLPDGYELLQVQTR